MVHLVENRPEQEQKEEEEQQQQQKEAEGLQHLSSAGTKRTCNCNGQEIVMDK